MDFDRSVRVFVGVATICFGFFTSIRALRTQRGGVTENPIGFLTFIGGGAVGALGFALAVA